MVSSNEGILASAPLLVGMEKAFQVCIWCCRWDAAGGHSWLSDDGGCRDVWMAVAGTAQWSMKPHALGSPFTLLGPKCYLRPRITRRNKQTNKTNHDSERCEYFQPWNDYKKTDLNEWIILMIKEKQIELFLIHLLSSFYLDASLLLLVKGPLKSADWTRPVKLAICFSMACILSL